MFWPEINGYIGGYISYGQWPDRRGSACAYAPKCASAHQKTKSEIGLHHGIFLCRHLGEKLNTTL